MEVINSNIFSNYPFYVRSYGKKYLLGTYDFSDGDEAKIINSNNLTFLENKTKLESNLINSESFDLNDYYKEFIITVNSDKVTDCLIQGISKNNNNNINAGNNYLSLKTKSVNDSININGTYAILLEEHKKYNLRMLEDSLKGKYYISIIIKTAQNDYKVEIACTHKSNDRWRTWFIGHNQEKMFHIGIHPRIKYNGYNVTKLVIDDFVQN